MIAGILLLLFLGDFLWWWRADRVLRRLPRSAFWRTVLGAFLLAQAVGLLLLILNRRFDLPLGGLLTSQWLIFIYLWHCLFLFPILLLWIPYAVTRAIVAGVRHLLLRRAERRARATAAPGQQNQITRREFARLLGTAAPALTSIATAAVALWQIKNFRLRSIEVPIADLPPALDGLTIAHLTDLHVGQFTRGEVLERIVAATNDLDADLVLYTGDLINFALSDLNDALVIAGRLKSRHGLFLCEGNHDLFEDPVAFRQRTRAAGLRLLVNESAVIQIRGVPVQLMGLRWGARGSAPHDPSNRGDGAIAESMKELLTQRQPDAFPILLAHHPHAFDFATDIPLTLAGHTHGGQLMATQNIGFGPMLYRYWSGLYQIGKRALVVSNGTGNWFPLRTRAPAEVIHLTLRRA